MPHSIPQRVRTLTLATLAAAALSACQSVPHMDDSTFASLAAKPNAISCEFKTTGTGSANEAWAGSCAIPCMVNSLFIDIDGPRKDRSCNTPVRSATAALNKTERTGHYLGTMVGKEPEDPTRFELLVKSNASVAKLPYGWFAVAAQQTRGDSVRLVLDGNKTLPATQDDLQILNRATALLANNAVWNKQDNRQCPKGADKLSVFCALIQATEETSGGYHYRQPAMQAVREAVNEVGGKRVDKHRLMDYNNHPDTTLAKIHTLLQMAQNKVQQRLRP
jgi:hypothetical protein